MSFIVPVGALIGVGGKAGKVNEIYNVAGKGEKGVKDAVKLAEKIDKNPKLTLDKTGKFSPKIPVISTKVLPDDAKLMFNKYDKTGWSGTVKGQPDGTKAGGRWKNLNATLPTSDKHGKVITYKEFDVSGKVANQQRNAPRFVHGSDGSTYYTADHYKTFKKVK
ncbi:hypothetical protein EQG49_04210 [Periweissella cryptocerci]|uniref:Uncharacterized protein n=1 Tax=Periweissella cryptocerci TaxID=2506420 RepID=A0A4P6YSS9_9LACO|nr:ribonuclease domain-containing protein [Periweissella cryptocerci]QBO35721.1 hypothetical protein EQG49_04210 [Periweissella cryptocerci]